MIISAASFMGVGLIYIAIAAPYDRRDEVHRIVIAGITPEHRNHRVSRHRSV